MREKDCWSWELKPESLVFWVLKNSPTRWIWPEVLAWVSTWIWSLIWLGIERPEDCWMPWYPYIYIHIHTCMHACIHTYLPTYLHTYIHTHTHTYIHTHIHTYIHTYIHTHTQTHIHLYIYIYVNRHTDRSRYIDIYMSWTYKYIYIYMFFDLNPLWKFDGISPTGHGNWETRAATNVLHSGHSLSGAWGEGSTKPLELWHDLLQQPPGKEFSSWWTPVGDGNDCRILLAVILIIHLIPNIYILVDHHPSWEPLPINQYNGMGEGFENCPVD